jgi:hypothetical protein
VAGGRPRDAWLFLTPEVEREVPALLARLAGDERLAAAESGRIEALIHRGSAAGWFAYLRECRIRLERAHAAGADPEAARRLALVLREQHLLAPGVPRLRPPEREELERLQALARGGG